MMARPILAGFLSAFVLALICAGIHAFSERADVAEATLSKVNTIVGVDTNTTSNDGTHVGTIDRCVAITSSGTFYIDLFVKDVTNLWSWDGTFSFDPNVVAVNSQEVNGFFLGSNNAPFLDCSHGDQCQVSNHDATTSPHVGHTGSGVLSRLALTPIAVGSTTQTSKLYFTWDVYGESGVTLLDNGSPAVAIGNLDDDDLFDGLVFNAIVVVGTNATCPTDADPDGPDPDLDAFDGFTNVEESVDGSDLLDEDSTPEICDGEDIDNDKDGATDEWYDRYPVNGIPDCVDTDSNTDAECDNGIDDDGDTKINDGCPKVGANAEAVCNEAASACLDDDGVPPWDNCDDDGDTKINDGCPTVGALAERVGDTSFNPTDTDDDNDGFSDELEAYLATDSLANCPGHPYHSAPLYPYHSAWPLDINNDKSVSVVGDISSFAGLIGSREGDGKFRKRLDLNADGRLTVVGDVSQFAGRIGQNCS